LFGHIRVVRVAQNLGLQRLRLGVVATNGSSSCRGPPGWAPVVDEVSEEAREDTRQRRVRYLDTHKRALYEIISEAGPDGIHSEDPCRRYKNTVQDPKSTSNRRRSLDSLKRCDLVDWERKAQDRQYWVKSTGN